MILAAKMTCIGFLVFFQCEEKKPAKPDPQKVVCSGPVVPGLTDEEKARTPLVVKRFMGKVQRNRIDHHCTETVK